MDKLVDYIEFKLAGPPSREEELTMLLFDNGVEGVEVDDPAAIRRHLEQGDWDASVFDGDPPMGDLVRLRSLMPLDEAGRRAAEAVRAATNAMDDVDCEINVVEPVDWQEKWKEGFRARPVGEKLWVRPAWDDSPVPEGRIPLTVNPGMAFGTGDHPTTSMVLEMIEEYIEPGQTIVDLGCGSGILAIAGLLLGAEQAVGVDLDPVCEEAVREHLRLNGIDESRFTYYTGDIVCDDRLQHKIRRQKGQLVVANITKDVLVDLAGVAGRFMAPQGVICCSGVLRDFGAEVAEALVYANMSVINSRTEGEWAAFAAVRAYE
ncbi:MAG: 50S ribosomal protein L11 methyltransferase [Firmicutes bacterium]|nr:50S ribosomal protein L11 methyltransferase [Bacillota bacterium]